MCLDVYSKKQPIQIPFEDIRIRFLGPDRYISRFTILVRNSGYESIDKLIFLYPRALYRSRTTTVETKPYMQIAERDGHFLADATPSIPELATFVGIQTQPDRILHAQIADPNYPSSFLTNVYGHWYVDNHQIRPVIGLTFISNWLLCELDFSAWEISLTKPIDPGQARWFCLELGVSDIGCAFTDTPIGSVVYHEVTSPIDVHRALIEAIQISLRDLITLPDQLLERAPGLNINSVSTRTRDSISIDPI
jgi:hypothetical protein